MSQYLDPPNIEETDHVQRWLKKRWVIAAAERESERAHGPRAHNVGATIAGHKMQWLKELIEARKAGER